MLDLRKSFTTAASALLLASGALMQQATTAGAETVLRIAMTAGDIPSWTGQPDQGFEGYRFVAYALYDGLTNWDLSRSDKEVDIRPGLATKWYPDPKDPKRWVFELRRDVKFHDGCDWDADAAIANIKRLTDKTDPAFEPVN